MTAENPLEGMEPSGPETDGWEPPIPLGTDALPAFPVSALAPWMADYGRAVSHAVQVPFDLVGPLLLSAVAASVARKVIIEVKPRYTEPLNVWTVAPLESGNRKSQCVSLIAEPIRAWEAERAEGLRDQIAEEQSRVRIRAAALSRAERTAANDRDANIRLMAEAEALTLATEVGRSTVTALPRILAGDMTPEAFATLLAEQDGRIAIIVAEGDIFELMAGRYSGSVPNIGHFLAAHVGDNIDVDRQGRPPQHIARPALTQGVTPQPSAMHGLITKPGFMGRGLLNRYLYATPTSWLGERDTRAPGITQDEEARYATRLRALLDIPMPSTGAAHYNPHVIYLDNDARNLHDTFEDSIEPRLSKRGDLYPIRGWGSKLPGAVTRLAAVLHMAQYGAHGLDAPIDTGTMGAAITLGQYFIPHTLAAFRTMAADDRAEGADTILGWIERKGKRAFTQRECWQSLRRHFAGAEQINGPLALLCEHGYLREVAGDGKSFAPDTAPKAGRPTKPHYQVNPLKPEENDTEIVLCTNRVRSVYAENGADNQPDTGQNGAYSHKESGSAPVDSATTNQGFVYVCTPPPSTPENEDTQSDALENETGGAYTRTQNAPEMPVSGQSTQEKTLPRGNQARTQNVHDLYTKNNNVLSPIIYKDVSGSYVNLDDDDEGDPVE